jgi:hypothetical protein
VQSVLVAVIAVVGTLGGAIVTGFIQHRSAIQREDAARSEHLREERLETCLAFVQSVAEVRGAMSMRWTARDEHGRDSDQYQAAKAEAYRVRVSARSALVRVQLLIDDEELARTAQEALTAAIAVFDAGDEGELGERTQHSRDATDAFVAAAGRRAHVR